MQPTSSPGPINDSLTTSASDKGSRNNELAPGVQNAAPTKYHRQPTDLQGPPHPVTKPADVPDKASRDNGPAPGIQHQSPNPPGPPLPSAQFASDIPPPSKKSNVQRIATPTNRRSDNSAGPLRPPAEVSYLHVPKMPKIVRLKMLSNDSFSNGSVILVPGVPTPIT